MSSNNLPSPFETIQFLPFLKNNKHHRKSKNNRRYPRATCNTIQTKAAIAVQPNVSLNDRSHGRNDTRTGCNTRQMNEKGGRPTYTAPRVAQKFYLDICCSLHASGCTRERLELKINRITTVWYPSVIFSVTVEEYVKLEFNTIMYYYCASYHPLRNSLFTHFESFLFYMNYPLQIAIQLSASHTNSSIGGREVTRKWPDLIPRHS